MNARTLPSELEDDAGRGQVAMLRVPPHSIEAESSVLGGLLLDNNAWDRVGDLLVDSDFYRYEHRLIFAAISALVNASRSADVVTVFVELQKTGKADEAGALVYLNSLAQYVPSASNIRRYAEVVRERSILRQLVSASDEIATAAFNTGGRTVATILDEAEQRIFKIGQAQNTDDEWEDVAAGVVKLLDRVQAAADGNAVPDFVATGLRDLDDRLDGGAREGELIVIGARPGMGKSALGLSIAANVAEGGHPVAIFSMEMGKAQVNNRLMAMKACIHLSKIKRPERLNDFDWPRLTSAVDRVRHLPIRINDQSSLNINQIRTKARALKRRHGLRLMVVDYLGLMAGMDPRQLRAYQIEEITKGLKALAKELGISILLLVQVNRGVEDRPDQMPILSDLRDSGAIEQDADIVIFVHRPIKSKPDLGAEWKDYAKVSVAKLRDGEPGYLDLLYVGENTHFLNFPSDRERPTSHVRVKNGASL